MGAVARPWDDSHDCSVPTRDAGCLGRTVWEEERELPFMGAQLEHTELCLEIDEELTKSLWAKIKEKTGTGDIVGVCYRPPDQQEQPS